jgi:hypothetical protein
MDTTALTPAFAPSAPRSSSRWPARILTAVTALFLAFDGVMKLAMHPEVVKGTERLQLPGDLSPVFGAILLACLALYLIPRTAVIGAVLLTGYLGGAVLVHLRMHDPLLTHTLFPTYVGIALWLGLYLRDERVRSLLAPRRR